MQTKLCLICKIDLIERYGRAYAAHNDLCVDCMDKRNKAMNEQRSKFK